MTPLICETVTASSMAGLLAARDQVREADLVELRLDGVGDLDVAGALAGRQRPVVVTCRPVWEGGRFDGAEEERLRILSRALELGADYVDVEWRADFTEFVAQHAARVVLSAHDFAGVPQDLASQAHAMRTLGTGLIKIAVMPHRLSDLLPLREIGREGAAIVIGMGGVGLPTRLLAAHFGSRWSYAGHGAAPGQIPAARMVEEFRFREIGPASRVFGVVGNNVLHSLSPAMHNAAFRAAGMDAVYVPLLAADFADFLTFADAMGVEGASVTIPFKRDAYKAAADITSAACRAGAANTLRRIAEGFSATNTDILGFLAPLETVLPRPRTGLRVAVLGAGGSARAAVAGLVADGMVVSVHARRPEQAAELVALGATVGTWPVEPGTWDVLVNCTPAGSAALPDESPLPGGPFDGRLVYDLTYRRPSEGLSPLLGEARAAGCQVLDGLPMLVAQAEIQFHWWTGRTPVPGVMANAVGARLEQQA